jgi:hypothetical protein
MAVLKSIVNLHPISMRTLEVNQNGREIVRKGYDNN